MSEFAGLLRQRLDGTTELSDAQVDRMQAHHELLTQWNSRLNLTAIRSLEEAVDKHYAESIFLAVHLPPGVRSIVDIGSGGGFPGAPIAIVRPELAVDLVESHTRKSVFLRESTRDLANVSVRNARIESVSEQFDCATMRAVAWRDVRRILPRVARSVGFLLSEQDASEAQRALPFEFDPPIALPWDANSVVLRSRFHVELGK